MGDEGYVNLGALQGLNTEREPYYYGRFGYQRRRHYDLADHDDPRDIADYLIQEHGLNGALDAAIEGAMIAQNARDNYALSVWREIKAVIRERQAKEKARKAEAAEKTGDTVEPRFRTDLHAGE